MSRVVEIFKHMEKHPGMYFGGGEQRRSICYLAAFVMGREEGMSFPEDSTRFTHFTRWVASHYRVIDGPNNGFTLILEHVGGDERLAFDEFFRLLPAYVKDMAELGPEGVHARYGEVMSQIEETT